MLLRIVDIRFQVLFHLPVRHAFHLSLTVLVHYRSLHIFSLGRWSSRIPTEFHVLRSTWDMNCTTMHNLQIRGSHPLRPTFPCRSPDYAQECYGSAEPRRPHPATPQTQRLPSWHVHGLGCSQFARHYYGNLILISFPPAT